MEIELQTLHTGEDLSFYAYGESRIGGRAENQDSYGAKITERGFLFTVCDGMGGGPGGKTASAIAVSEIIAGVEEAPQEEENKNVLIKAIRRANMSILAAGNETPKLRGMGSTATVLLLTEQAAYVAHVGDSRVYQLRGHTKVFRTFDHSMVFDLVRQGILTEEQARLSAQSNVITRALGIQPDVEVDIQELPYLKGDRFLLCSDGIHGCMPELDLIRLATSRKEALGTVVDDLATSADDIGREAGGGHDNLTLIIVETKTNSTMQPIMNKNTRMVLMALTVLLAVSILMNIVQCANNKQPADVSSLQTHVDSLRKDSIRQHDAIQQLIQDTARLSRQSSEFLELARESKNQRDEEFERKVKNIKNKK